MTFEASRKRQILVLQPRGKALYEDETSFGSKMMAKMGWKKGNGLGKNQSGSTDFIQVKYKNNEYGLGFNGLKDDQWTETETQFDNLLKSLNDDQSTSEVSTEKKSLLEKSESSRARVHYKKRIQCKDVHRYSAKDLANILGKKSLDEVEDDTKNSQESESDSVEEVAAPTGSNLIVKSNINSKDYFKQVLSKKSQINEKIVIDDDEDECEVIESPPTETETTKKNKKRKKVEVEPEEVEEVPIVKKKKKKSKSSDPVESSSKVEVVTKSPEVVQISSNTAQKLANMKIDGFMNSNASNIIGYGLSENIEIKILKTKIGDTENPLTADKYALYNTGKVTKKRVNPRNVLSSIKRIKKRIQVLQ